MASIAYDIDWTTALPHLFGLLGGDGLDVCAPLLLAVAVEHVLDALDEAAAAAPLDAFHGVGARQSH